MAEPLGYDAPTRSVWQAEVRGDVLTERLAQGDAGVCLGGVASAMAALHRAPRSLAEGRRRGLDHWRYELPLRTKKVTRAAPELASLVNLSVGGLLRLSGSLSPCDDHLIHGDCHPDQFLVAGDRVVLFDFDEVALGDPMEDLEEFLVKLGVDGRARWGDALTQAYAHACPELFDERRLRWHEAVQQLLQACRAFIFQLPDWRETMERCLQRAAVITDAMERSGDPP